MFRLKRQLKKLSQQAAPSRTFKSELWHKLAQEIDEVPECIPVRRFRFVTASAIASLVLVFGMGTGVYAYESPSVVEGHPLHFVKSGIETVQENFARSPEMKARFHAEMMARRLDEGEHNLQDSLQVERALQAASMRLEMSVGEMVQGLQDETARNEIINKLSVHRARYMELAGRVLESEGEIGGEIPLQVRAQGWGLSEEETTRLFQVHRRGPGAASNTQE